MAICRVFTGTPRNRRDTGDHEYPPALNSRARLRNSQGNRELSYIYMASLPTGLQIFLEVAEIHCAFMKILQHCLSLVQWRDHTIVKVVCYAIDFVMSYCVTRIGVYPF